MKKSLASQNVADFGIRVDHQIFETPQLTRPSSGTRIGFQLNATPLSSYNDNSRTSNMALSRLDFQHQVALSSGQTRAALRNDANDRVSKSDLGTVESDDKSGSHTSSRRSSVAPADWSRSNSRPSTANTRDIGGAETRRSSVFGGAETRRSSVFGGSETRRSSVFGGASRRSSASSRSMIKDTSKDLGSINLARNEIILTNGNLSGLIHILTNFLWLAAGEKRFGSRSVTLVMPEAFTNASLFHDEFVALATYCCSELKESSTLHSYIAELVALATWQKFKTRMSMFFLFGSVQGPLSPDQRSTSREFSAKLQELAFALCGNLENIQFQAQLSFDVLVDSGGLEEHLITLLERANNGIAEAPPPEFSIAIDQFVRNQAQAHISPHLSDIKTDIESNLFFHSSRLSSSHRSHHFALTSGTLKLEPQDLQEQVEHLLNDRAPYWPESSQVSVLSRGGDFFVREMIRSAEKESLRAKNTLEALKAAQNKILTLERKLVSNQELDLIGFPADISSKSSRTSSAKLSTPTRRKSSTVQSRSGNSTASTPKPLPNGSTSLNAMVAAHLDEDKKTKAFVSLETIKYQLTTGIEGLRITILADSMKGTTFEYSGQFETGSAGLLTRQGSGRCEWKSPGGFLCWYAGDWQNDRPHGWGRSGRGALVESGVFEEGRLSLKGWPEILDSGTKTIIDNPRWPAQRGRSESTVPDPEPPKFPSARISPPEPPAIKRPPWYQRLSSTNPEVKEERVLPVIASKSSTISVAVDQVIIASYKPFCCFWSEGSCEKCPSDGDSMSLSEAYSMACIASHLAQENFATNLEKEQKSGLFVLVCTRGNERCNIVLFGNKLEGLPQEYAGAVSPQTRMRNGFGICIWHSVVYGSCWYASPRAAAEREHLMFAQVRGKVGRWWVQCGIIGKQVFRIYHFFRSPLRLGPRGLWCR